MDLKGGLFGEEKRCCIQKCGKWLSVSQRVISDGLSPVKNNLKVKADVKLTSSAHLQLANLVAKIFSIILKSHGSQACHTHPSVRRVERELQSHSCAREDHGIDLPGSYAKAHGR